MAGGFKGHSLIEHMVKNFLLVGLGGMLRLAVNMTLKTVTIPLATFLINIVGSLVIGIVIGLAIRSSQFDTNWRLFLATGLCGGFTTFSSFSLESLLLLQQQRYILFLLYLFLSIVFGITATWAGITLVSKV